MINDGVRLQNELTVMKDDFTVSLCWGEKTHKKIVKLPKDRAEVSSPVINYTCNTSLSEFITMFYWSPINV